MNEESQISLEKIGATEIAISVRTPYAALEPLLPKAAQAIAETVAVEGFRKGKAPYEVVKARVGEFRILEEAAQHYIREHFTEILKEAGEQTYGGKGFEPVGEPEIAITKLAPGDEFAFKISLSLLPALELPDYRAISRRVSSTKRVPEVIDREVAEAKEWLRESRVKLVTVNRGAEQGDRVEIDFSASSDGMQIGGGESKNHPLVLGKSKFLPGFDEQLVGMKAGEEKSFEIAVPTDYADRTIAGKTLGFDVTMNLVQERQLPAWDDAFAQSLGSFQSADEAEANIREGLVAEKEARERERVRMEMTREIAAETKADIPPVLVDRELGKMIAELKGSIERTGLAFDDYLIRIRKTEADLKKDWRSDAEERVKIALVLREIARRESIEPNENDMREAARKTADHRATAPEHAHALDRGAYSDYHRGVARNEKVFRWLESFA